MTAPRERSRAVLLVGVLERIDRSLPERLQLPRISFREKRAEAINQILREMQFLVVNIPMHGLWKIASHRLGAERCESRAIFCGSGQAAVVTPSRVPRRDQSAQVDIIDLHLGTYAP